MNKVDVVNSLNIAKAFLVKHSPEILTGIGITGMATSTILAVTATPKAMKLIEAKKEELEMGPDEKLPVVETVKTAWKPYVPAVATGVAGAACLIGASATNYRRNAALAAAYQVVSTTLTDYKEQVVETLGEKKEKVVREKVAQKKLDRHPEVTQQVIVTGTGDVLFVDPLSMRSFTFDIEKLRSIVNDLNHRMIVGYEEYISLSEFYDEIGLSRTAVSDDIGWNLGKDGPIEITWHACSTEDNKPAFMLEYLVAPRRGFERLM